MMAQRAIDRDTPAMPEVSLESSLESSRPRLLRLAQLRGVPPDLAEDVVQETLLEAWKSLDRVYDIAGVHRWLDEICRNVCRRHARKHETEQRHRRLLTFAADDGGGNGAPTRAALDSLPDSDIDDPIEALNRQEMALLLGRALDLLPDQAREVVELCYLREIPQREATERLGLSLSALEARLHRARRSLRILFNGPLRNEAVAFGLTLDDANVLGWQETRLWCPLCGRHRLSGMFLIQSDGSANLHMRCPDCERRYGLCDIDSSTVHSKGLIQLDGLRSFRPAWKRTMRGTAQRYTQALQSGVYRCPYCGAPATLHLVDKIQVTTIPAGAEFPDSLAHHPYRFWVWWRCDQPQSCSSDHSGLFAASDLIYWSQTATQQFMREHPRWLGEPELLVEYEGRPALRLQMADATSAARLTVLADRQTLRVLALYP